MSNLRRKTEAVVSRRSICFPHPNRLFRRVGIAHLCVMLLTVAIFAVDFWMRRSQHYPYSTPFILSIIGLLVLRVGGWFGAKLVHVFGIRAFWRSAATF